MIDEVATLAALVGLVYMPPRLEAHTAPLLHYMSNKASLILQSLLKGDISNKLFLKVILYT